MDKLEALFRELASLSTSPIYDLRIVASVARRMLTIIENPYPGVMATLRNGVVKINAVLAFYTSDPNIDRLYRRLKELERVLSTDQYRDNAASNPINYGDGPIPGAMIYSWATGKGYSADFAEEMQEVINRADWDASKKEDVELFLTMAANHVRIRGTVYAGSAQNVNVVRRVLQKADLMYDVYPVYGGKGYAVWVPVRLITEARQALTQSGIRPFEGHSRTEDFDA